MQNCKVWVLIGICLQSAFNIKGKQGTTKFHFLLSPCQVLMRKGLKI